MKTKINFDFKIENDVLLLFIVKGTKAGFFSQSRPGKVMIICPPDTLFENNKVQEWLHKVVLEALRKQAKLYLPPRMALLAAQQSFQYKSISINSARTRWGSCSGRKTINLSLYLMLLPQRLSDYVILHELCHTRQMNHGILFWKEMELVTEGKAKDLRKELKTHKTSF